MFDNPPYMVLCRRCNNSELRSDCADGALDEGLSEGPYDDGWQKPDDPVPEFPGKTWLFYFGVRGGVDFTVMD